MELILWRHAEAEDRARDSDDDAARHLTKRGRRQAERMAAWLGERLDDSWRIVASPAVRTVQTVEALGRDFETSEDAGLSTTPQRLLRLAGWPAAETNVLVVGHQPTLGQAAAFILEGHEGDVSVRKGSAWWFVSRERDGRREAVLKAVVDPDLLDK